ncbi:hypothetical protein J6590_003638 [Homalodisca vitripennis]|nr:hypothetical protein J6590_003638 [Homalodisca vitripennis]
MEMVTSEPPPMAGQAGCLQGQDHSAATHPSSSHARRSLIRSETVQSMFSPTTTTTPPVAGTCCDDLFTARSQGRARSPQLLLLHRLSRGHVAMIYLQVGNRAEQGLPNYYYYTACRGDMLR